MNKAPAAQNTIGVGWAPIDFEFNVSRAAGLFLPFDDRYHGRLLQTKRSGWRKRPSVSAGGAEAEIVALIFVIVHCLVQHIIRRQGFQGVGNFL